ncbi:MAG: ThuA domain-containing protein [Treponema sp.]|nr:ThuA domain-containing protein [Treponema sp.]
MRILMLCDDYYHPGQVPIDGIAPLSQQGFRFDVIKNANDFSCGILNQYPAVLLCKMDEISQTDKGTWKTAAVQDAFKDYVESGGGILAVHSAVVSSREIAALDKMLGCRFLGHPNNSPVTVQPVKQHPVTEGVGMFCETDEHYNIEIFAQDADVLLASYSPAQGEESKYKEEPYFNAPAAIYPAGFVRTQGKGRICVLSPGHLPDVWSNPHFQKLLSNALKWCANK